MPIKRVSTPFKPEPVHTFPFNCDLFTFCSNSKSLYSTLIQADIQYKKAI